MSPDGVHIYVSNNSSTTAGCTYYSRNSSTGLLTSLGDINIGSTGAEVCISSDGQHVYFAGGAALFQFSRSSSTGALTALSPASILGGVYGIEISPDGNSVYAADTASSIIEQHSRG